MAHFAQLDVNQVVVTVIVVDNNELIEDGVESEQKGIAFCQNLFPGTQWVQTSYNASFRKNYAGVGFIYDTARDAFVPPKPFASWVLDEQKCVWIPPIKRPDDGKKYKWDENSVSWVEVIETNL